jgi:uncharacterized membrane protein YjjP (DUF1212 family)
MLNSPLLVLSAVIATLYSALFHLLWGQTFRELGISWLAGMVGFGLGQVLASSFGWGDIRIGELHLLAASAFCWLFMALARRLKL